MGSESIRRFLTTFPSAVARRPARVGGAQQQCCAGHTGAVTGAGFSSAAFVGSAGAGVAAGGVVAGVAVGAGFALAAGVWAIVEKTRSHEHLSLGVSPRGAQAFFRAAQAMAALAQQGLRGRLAKDQIVLESDEGEVLSIEPFRQLLRIIRVDNIFFFRPTASCNMKCQCHVI